ncbi:putative carbohydrate transporter [Hibiscus syriacus]|uniref:Carbohydrate transporter n=1 Tax=Hibiscus syriacus TaxID=106335 RepID=A0A6A2WWP2_HIBSY|nr:putative carbohydrate transporter [Hibiscus syriacus]
MQMADHQSESKLQGSYVYTKVCISCLANSTFYACARVHISDLNLPTFCSISFPNGKDDLMNFEVSIRPGEGYYVNATYFIPLDLKTSSPGGTLLFSFQVSPTYPHEAPKVKCKTMVDCFRLSSKYRLGRKRLPQHLARRLETGAEYKHSNLWIISSFHGTCLEPNHEDPLNHDAASVLRDNPKMFESNVRRAMYGGYVGQTYFPRCM